MHVQLLTNAERGIRATLGAPRLLPICLDLAFIHDFACFINNRVILLLRDVVFAVEVFLEHY